jgi:hypothetical protein
MQGTPPKLTSFWHSVLEKPSPFITKSVFVVPLLTLTELTTGELQVQKAKLNLLASLTAALLSEQDCLPDVTD